MPTKPGKTGKQRNKSAAGKRFKKSGSGNWRKNKAACNHLLIQKSKRQKKAASKYQAISSGNSKKLDKMLPSK